MRVTCSLCAKTIEGLVAYENHVRTHQPKPKGLPLVRTIIALGIAREITK